MVQLLQVVQLRVNQLQISGQFQVKLLLLHVLAVTLVLLREFKQIVLQALFVQRVQLKLQQHRELYKTKQIFFIKSLAHLVQFVEVVQELLLLLVIILLRVTLVQLKIIVPVVIHALQALLVLTKLLVMKVSTMIIQEQLDLLAPLVLPVHIANKVLKLLVRQECIVM